MGPGGSLWTERICRNFFGNRTILEGLLGFLLVGLFWGLVGYKHRITVPRVPRGGFG